MWGDMSIHTATQQWLCFACNRPILPGQRMSIENGEFTHADACDCETVQTETEGDDQDENDNAPIACLVDADHTISERTETDDWTNVLDFE